MRREGGVYDTLVCPVFGVGGGADQGRGEFYEAVHGEDGSSCWCADEVEVCEGCSCGHYSFITWFTLPMEWESLRCQGLCLEWFDGGLS